VKHIVISVKFLNQLIKIEQFGEIIC